MNGKDLVKRFEGKRLEAYLCPAGVPTIGYGSTFYEDGSKVKLGDKITEARANELLDHIYKEFETDVKAIVKVPINENQLGALVSFAFNLGIRNLQNSTLLKLINSGNFTGAAEEFVKWNKAGGKVLTGLTTRRLAERDLFLSPVQLIEPIMPSNSIQESSGLIKLIKNIFRKK